MSIKKDPRSPYLLPILFLFFTALFIRLPFFFRDYIDRDESTFILMGQSIADGHLPYAFLWDLKPPLLFYIFGLIEYLFPHSLIAIRLLGVLIVFFSAWILKLIARKASIKNENLIALSYVLLSSLFGNIQGLMSEHLAVFFILSGILAFLYKKPVYLLIAGLLFGCALLTKINYAYAIVALMLCYSFSNFRKAPFIVLFRNLSMISIGIIFIFLLISIPFILKHQLPLFIDSVFLAPLEYGHTTEISAIKKLAKTWWIIGLGLTIAFFALRNIKNEHKNIVYNCVAILAGTIFTFYSSGKLNSHYLIQVYPFFSILAIGVILKKEFHFHLAKWSALVLLISVESSAEYYKLSTQYIKTSTLYNGPTFEIVNELKKRNLHDRKVFFADYHIGYWFLNQHPLTKSTTHPSNLTRPFLFKFYAIQSKNSLDELKYLMKIKRPEIIVSKNESLGFFPNDGIENNYFRNTIESSFELIYKNPEQRIYIWARTKS